MDRKRIVEAAAAVVQARDGAARMTLPLPGGLPPADIAEAYAIQDAVLDRYLAMRPGRKIGGWKIALTTPTMQSMCKIDHPCEGAIFADRIQNTDGTCRADRFSHLGGESEIAVRLGADLPAGGSPWTADSVAPHVDALMPAIEIVDDRHCAYGEVSGGQLIAENAFNYGIVLGRPRQDWHELDLAAIKGRMLVDGKPVGEGRGADALGHPLAAVAWAANALNARGRRIEKGQVVMTGSLVRTFWLGQGQTMETEIEGLGRAKLWVI